VASAAGPESGAGEGGMAAGVGLAPVSGESSGAAGAGEAAPRSGGVLPTVLEIVGAAGAVTRVPTKELAPCFGVAGWALKPYVSLTTGARTVVGLCGIVRNRMIG
jgi:hypothetical protein